MKRPALILSALLLAVVLGIAPKQADAQTHASLPELAAAWVGGRYGSPLLCEIDGEPVHGMRRLNVIPGSNRIGPLEVRLIFVSMEVETATRCFTDIEKSVPDITGSLRLRFPGPPRRESASREFKALLRRENGVEFEIAGGMLRMREVGSGADEKRDIDFRGGKARFSTVGPGTDAERMLSSITSPRKLQLVVSGRDGTAIKLPLFLVEGR